MFIVRRLGKLLQREHCSCYNEKCNAKIDSDIANREYIGHNFHLNIHMCIAGDMLRYGENGFRKFFIGICIQERSAVHSREQFKTFCQPLRNDQRSSV